MAQARYCTLADVKAELNIPETETQTDALIERYIDRACASLERELRLSWALTTLTDRIYQGRDLVRLTDGRLKVRIGIAPILTVTALATRIGYPTASWSDTLTYLDLETADDQWWVTIYNGGWSCSPWSLPTPLAVRVTGTAGHAGTDLDPYPLDVVQMAVVWTVYLYRTKDAPFEKTANTALGTMTIPGSFPKKLEPMLARWREYAVA